MRLIPTSIIIIIALIFGVMNSFFVIDQTQQALVLRFGKPVNIVQEAGLKFKMPFIDDVLIYDKRILAFNARPMTMILRDQDRLIVDAFVTYKITNMLEFYQAVRSERIMNNRLESILEKSLRDILGKENLITLLSKRRSEIMINIRNKVAELTSGSDDANKNKNGFGIKIIDVRIMRTDLPKETSMPIYNRMRSDRQKVAEKFRAEGKRESQIIRSDADKKRTIMIAKAKEKAETIRGEGDGIAANVSAKAFGRDIQFYEFYRSMQAYKKALKKDNTTLILSSDNNFLKYIGK